MINSTIDIEKAVLDFQKKYSHFLPESGELASFEKPINVLKLRRSLIEEEFIETLDAFDKKDIIEFADGCADLVYVVVGACIAFGIPFNRVFREVHNSNMTKTAVKADADQKYGTKTPKGADYRAPDIRGILTHPERSTVLEELNGLEVPR